MDRFKLSALTKELALAAGFDTVGITRAEPSRQLERFRAWIEAGRAGEMAYLTRPDALARRAQPQLSLPEARSVIVVGLNYAQPTSEPGVEARPRGRIAQYARHQDYHTVMAERLRWLAAEIELAAGEPFARRAYVDTGPLLERELAARAGLGWQGKHTCLIHPRRGSYLLLGELLVSLDLAPDEPFAADRCGSCRRCLDACPTGALVGPRALDARRCISYLTIELKGSIPLELRPQVGDWVFGCDICQDVCPWNQRFARPTGDREFAARDDLAAPDLAELLALDAAGFAARFRGSPLKRAKRRGLLRNAAVALGNAGDLAALPALTAALDDEEPLVRAHAAWAVGRLAAGSARWPAARRALEAALGREVEASVRREIEAAIVTIGENPPVEGEAIDAHAAHARPGDVPEPAPRPGL